MIASDNLIVLNTRSYTNDSLKYSTGTWPRPRGTSCGDNIVVTGNYLLFEPIDIVSIGIIVDELIYDSPAHRRKNPFEYEIFKAIKYKHSVFKPNLKRNITFKRLNMRGFV